MRISLAIKQILI